MMTRYLMLWETELASRTDSSIAMQMIKEAIRETKDEMQKGHAKDWGAFAGSGRGYAIVEAKDEVEAFQFSLKWRKYNIRTTSLEPVLTIEQAENVFRLSQ